MIVLVWMIPIVGGAIIQVLITKLAGVHLGALPIIIIYAPLISIAIALTKHINKKRTDKAKTELRKHEDESGMMISSCVYKGQNGQLECTDEAFVFTTDGGKREEYLYMDIANSRVEKKDVVIVDQSYEEHKFRVDNTKIWATKIDEIRKQPMAWDGKFKVIQLLRNFNGSEEELDNELFSLRRKNLITQQFAEVALQEYKTSRNENRKINEELLENSTSLAVYWYRQGKCMKCGGELEKRGLRRICKSCGSVDTSR